MGRKTSQSDVVRADQKSDTVENFAVVWFENRLNQIKEEIHELYKDFRLNEILKTIYSLIWDDFCSWYLEWIKPASAKAFGGQAHTRESRGRQAHIR